MFQRQHSRMVSPRWSSTCFISLRVDWSHAQHAASWDYESRAKTLLCFAVLAPLFDDALSCTCSPFDIFADAGGYAAIDYTY